MSIFPPIKPQTWWQGFALRRRRFAVSLFIGVFSGSLCLLFSYLAHLDIDSYWQSPWLAVILPWLAIALVSLCERLFARHRQVGFAPAIAAYHYHSGKLPLGGLPYQFVVGLLLVWGGFAVGIVGPSCFIAAALAGHLSRFGFLGEKHQRLSVACGTAAAVAALFNAPLAATVLAYELVMRHFNWRAMVYVGLSAYSASILSEQFGGSMLKVTLGPQDYNWPELSQFLLLGAFCGMLAVTMVAAVRWAPKFQRRYSLIVAAAITSLACLYEPSWLGLDAMTPNEMLTWEVGVDQMWIWLLARLVLTATALSMLLPGGSLGPMLVIGGIAGAILGQLNLSPAHDVLIVAGMAAMFGAVFRCPWAAFMLLTEQTMQLSMVAPMLLACLSASLVAQHLFRSPSLIDVQLERAGYQVPHWKNLLRAKPNLPPPPAR